MTQTVFVLLAGATLAACGNTVATPSDASQSDVNASGADVARESGLPSDAPGEVGAMPDAAADATLDGMAAVDAGSDGATGADVGTDTGTDGGSDVGTDTGSDAGGMDAGTDGGSDAGGMDVGTDTAMDVGTDTAMDAGPVRSTDFWVLRIGDGTAVLSDSAAPVFLERRARASGTLLGTVALPTTASGSQLPFTLSGTGTIEGALSASQDRLFVVLVGYAAAPGTTAVANSTLPRVVAEVSTTGMPTGGLRNVDTATPLTAFSRNTVSGVTTFNGLDFWVAGTGAGVQWLRLHDSTSTRIIGSPSNIRAVGLFESQLYASGAASGYSTVFEVGAGLPVSPPPDPATTNFMGPPTGGMTSPYGFTLLDLNPTVPGVDRLYLADERAVASGGGVQAWDADGALVWHRRTAFGSVGARGVTAYGTGSSVTVLAVTTDGQVERFIDDGVTTSPATTVLATAAPNTTYGGITLGY